MAALLGTVSLPVAVHAVPACTAANVSSQDAQCPTGTGPCNISRAFEISEGCTLDFGLRTVTVTGRGEFNVLSNAATLRAGSFSVAPGGRVEGRGNLSSAPRNRGGMLTIQTTGPVNVQRSGASRGVFDFSGNARAGTVIIDAGGSVNVQGDLIADGLTTTGGNGSVTIRSRSDVIIGTSSTISITGGLTGTGGFLDIRAAGDLDIGTSINVNGGDGGVIDVLAGGEAIVRGLSGIGAGDAGSGGCASIFAGTRVQMLGPVVLNGTGSTTQSGGGCGGFIDIEARFGDATIGAPIAAESGGPDGGGGGVSVIAAGSILQGAGAPVSVQGIGPQSCGGEVSFEADLDVTASGSLNASGGFGGNLVDLLAGRNVSLNGMVEAQGRDTGSFGGSVTMLAGERGSGDVVINSSIDVGGGNCGALAGCGLGGFTEVSGCNVTVASGGSMLVRGGDGGDNLLVAREKLTVLGPLDATTVGGGANGTNTLQHPSRVAPAISAGLVTPTPTVQALTTCTTTGQTNCLVPCPACGNGIVEFPETCDQAGAAVNCDGCSNFCRAQNCNDANACTTDACDTILGCGNIPVADGISCTDNNVCNGLELCAFGACRASTPAPNCNDSNPCTTDFCHPAFGCQNQPAPTGTPCTDFHACTIGDVCSGGLCQSGEPQYCLDFNLCTTDACLPDVGCVFTPIAGCTTTTTVPGQTTSTIVPQPTTTTTSLPSLPTTTTSVPAGATTTSTSVPGATTTSTTTPGATTSTTLPGGCDAASCSDGNDCTTDVCQAGTCLHRREGFDAVACELAKLQAPSLCGADPIEQKLAKAITAKAAKARKLVDKAKTKTKTQTQRKLLARAGKQLAGLRRKIEKSADKGKISATCRGTLDALVGERQALLPGLLTL